MKIKSIVKNFFLNCGLDVRFANKQVKYLDLEDIKHINLSTLNYIDSLSQTEIKKRVETISCTKPQDINSIDNMRAILDKNGIVIIPEALDSDKIKEIRHQISQIIENVKTKDPLGTGYENDDYIVLGKKNIGNSYYDLSNYSKSAILVRQGVDQGMIEIFNADRLLGKLGHKMSNYFSSDWLINLLNDKEEKISPRNLNLYVNESITKTRGFHVDSHYKSIKAFIYLTDVNDMQDGPYCFVKGTHVDTPLKKLNNIVGNKETPLADPLNIVPVLGKKGTLIISDQSGIHRGIPQKKGSIREVLVMRYA